MYDKKEYETLLARNQISLMLDDMAAMTPGSSLAYDLREFSGEIMQIEPGFVFNLDQAKALRKRTDEAYKDMKQRGVNEVELMNYLSEARNILKGENIPNGGNRMGFFRKIFNSKEIKQQESRETLELQYKEVCAKVMNCEQVMQRAIEKGAGHAKDSMVYRDSAREYSNAKNQLTLLRKQQEHLDALLTKINQIDTVKTFNKTQEIINNAGYTAMGNEKDNDMALTKATLNMEKMKDSIEDISLFGQELYDSAEMTSLPHVDSEFDAQVAKQEVRRAAVGLSSANAPQAEPLDEFAAAVSKAENDADKNI